VRFELGAPAVHPAVADFGNTGGDIVLAASRVLARVRPEGVDERAQGELRVADKRVSGVDVFADVGGVERRVDVGLPGGELDAEARCSEAAADAEDDVGFLEEAVHGFRERTSTGSERKRVVLREGAFAFEAGGN